MGDKMNNVIEATIEIPMGTKNKYEIDKERGRIKLNRVQYSTMTYPAEYGFIDETLANDGDPLDILVLTTDPTFPGCLVDARVIGYLETVDNGFGDNKIIAVNNVDPRYNTINEIDDLTEHAKEEIKNFFETYKILQKIEVKTFGYHNKEEALKEIERTKLAYKNKKN